MADEKSTITSMMEETRKFPPSKEFVDQAYVKSREQYEKMWKESIENPEKFWGGVANDLFWFKKWDKVNQENFAKADIKWFLGGKTNIILQLPRLPDRKGKRRQGSHPFPGRARGRCQKVSLTRSCLSKSPGSPMSSRRRA